MRHYMAIELSQEKWQHRHHRRHNENNILIPMYVHFRDGMHLKTSRKKLTAYAVFYMIKLHNFNKIKQNYRYPIFYSLIIPTNSIKKS